MATMPLQPQPNFMGLEDVGVLLSPKELVDPERILEASRPLPVQFTVVFAHTRSRSGQLRRHPPPSRPVRGTWVREIGQTISPCVRPAGGAKDIQTEHAHRCRMRGGEDMLAGGLDGNAIREHGIGSCLPCKFGVHRICPRPLIKVCLGTLSLHHSLEGMRA